MKVLFSQHSLRGGIGRVVVQIASELAKSKEVSISVDASIGMELFDGQLKGAGVNRISYNFQNPFQRFFQIINLLRTNQYDVIFSSGILLSLNYLLCKSLVRSKIKIIVRDDVNIEEHLKWETGKIKGYLYKVLIRWLYPKADLIVAVSKGVARTTEKIANLKKGTIVEINNPGWDPNFLALSNEPIETKNLPKAEFIINVGRLTKQKNQKDLILAMKEVYQISGLHCVIIGEGEERNNLEKLILINKAQDYIHMVGWEKNPFKWMKKAKVVVLTSIYEGFGMVLIEAMGLGKANCFL